MQELQIDETMNNEFAKGEHGAEKVIDYKIPPNTTGIKISVAPNYKDEVVVLTVGESDYVLTLTGARGLALALRQTANRIGVAQFEQKAKARRDHKRR